MSDIPPPFQPYPTALTREVADTLYVNVTGDAMTAPLTLAGDPAAPLEASSKQYVDSAAAAAAAAPARWT